MGDLISQLECKPCPCRDCLPGQNTHRAEHGGKDAEFLGIHGKRGFMGHWAPRRRQEWPCENGPKALGNVSIPLNPTSPFHSTHHSRAHAHFPGLSGVYDFDQHGAAQVTLCDLPGGQKAMQLLPCFLDTHPRNPELPHQKPHPLRPPGCEETNPRGQPMERGLLASPVCMFPIQATGKCVHDPSGHLAPGQEWSPLRVPSRCCGASVNHLPALHRVPDA